MNKVFTIKQISHIDQTFEYSATIDAVHPVFRGHFPQAPVVPGVCTMDMIKECAADALCCGVRFDYIKECKFLLPIFPFDHPTLNVRITLDQSGDQMSITADVTSADSTMMKLKATLL